MEIRFMESEGAFNRAFCAGKVPEGLAGWAFPLDGDHFAREFGFEWSAVVTVRRHSAWSTPAGRFCATQDDARAWLKAYYAECE